MSADFIVALKQHLKGNDESLTDAKVAMAREAANYARSIAPVDEGDYRDGIQVMHLGASGVGVAFTDYKSRWIEFGTEDMEERAVAAKTAAHMRGDR
jgi:hypothetical protein